MQRIARNERDYVACFNDISQIDGSAHTSIFCARTSSACPRTSSDPELPPTLKVNQPSIDAIMLFRRGCATMVN